MGRVGEGELKELKFFPDQGLVLGVLHSSVASLQADRKQRSEGQTQIHSLLFSHSHLSLATQNRMPQPSLLPVS